MKPVLAEPTIRLDYESIGNRKNPRVREYVMTEGIENKILLSRRKKLSDLETKWTQRFRSPKNFGKKMGVDMETNAVRCRQCSTPLLGKVAISKTPSNGSGMRTYVTKYYCKSCATRIGIL